MGFLKSLLGGGAVTARRGDDQVWMSAGARAAGVRRAAERLVAQGHSVLVVVPSVAQVDAVASELAALQPGRVTDAFSRAPLVEALSSPGRVVVAAASALPAEAQPAGVAVDLIVWSRSRTRNADDAITAFADRLGAQASIGFWLSLDDALLAQHAERLGPILKALRAGEDEAITSPMVSRAIENAQKKNA